MQKNGSGNGQKPPENAALTQTDNRPDGEQMVWGLGARLIYGKQLLMERCERIWRKMVHKGVKNSRCCIASHISQLDIVTLLQMGSEENYGCTIVAQNA